MAAPVPTQQDPPGLFVQINPDHLENGSDDEGAQKLLASFRLRSIAKGVIDFTLPDIPDVAQEEGYETTLALVKGALRGLVDEKVSAALRDPRRKQVEAGSVLRSVKLVELQTRLKQGDGAPANASNVVWVVAFLKILCEEGFCELSPDRQRVYVSEE